VRAALDGSLEQTAMTVHPVFGIQVPQTCRDIPPEVLQPRHTWGDPQAYDAQTQRLAGMFVKNFQQFANDVTPQVRAAGPLTQGT
jgi:phosphoenolpyruvate carboxykinase (ATP)